jgi:hypothetical protein
MNAWFPHINPDDSIASGDTSVWVDGAQVAAVGGGPVWAGRTLIYSNRLDGSAARVIVGGVPVVGGYSALVGSDDDRWAGFAPGQGRIDLYHGITLERQLPECCAPRFAPGIFGYLSPFQSQPPAYQRTLFINDAPVAKAAILDFVLGDGLVVFQIATGVYTRALLLPSGEVVSIRDDEAPIYLFRGPGGAPWIVTQTQTGTLVRPLFSTSGYRIPGVLDNPDARMIGARLRVAGSDRGQPRFDNWIDFSEPRIPLIADPAPDRPAPSVPDPQPQPQPVPEPPPMSEPFLAPFIVDVIRRFVAVFPVPQMPASATKSDEPFENECRRWCFSLAEQVQFDTGDPDWGVKNAGGGRPQSKDSLTYNGPRLFNYDLLTGVGTGHPSLNLAVRGEDITGQSFMRVTAVNHLGGGPPKTPPKTPPAQPPTDPGELADLRRQVADLVARVRALEARPPVSLDGVTVGIRSVSREGLYLSTWDDNPPKFNRSRVGTGEKFILDVQE